MIYKELLSVMSGYEWYDFTLDFNNGLDRYHVPYLGKVHEMNNAVFFDGEVVIFLEKHDRYKYRPVSITIDKILEAEVIDFEPEVYTVRLRQPMTPMLHTQKNGVDVFDSWNSKWSVLMCGDRVRVINLFELGLENEDPRKLLS